jgi:DNA-binding IclR family transcriptional regulator
VLDVAPPFLRRVCQSTQLTTVISLWGSSGPVVSRTEEESTRPVLVTVRVGTQLGLRSAQAKVFLPFLTDQLRVDRLLATLPPDERDELSAQLDEVRRTGVATDHLVDLGITAAATCVFDEYGICATVALVGTVRTLPIEGAGPSATIWSPRRHRSLSAWAVLRRLPNGVRAPSPRCRD